MDIYVVQPGDTISSIADKYGVTVERLIQSNELHNPNDLVPGQTIVIAYPKQVHTVQEGDTLMSIAGQYGVTVNQLIRNNPYLAGREFIYPDETIVISYNTKGNMVTHGFGYPFIRPEIYKKTFPNLTYFSIFNYRATQEGEILTYYDDTELIQAVKEYGAAPIMMTTTLSQQGEPNIEVAYSILLNEEYQENSINNTLRILRSKGLAGVNMVFNYLNTTNQKLYESFITKVSDRLKPEGYAVFVTINPNIKNEDDEIIFERVDYTGISQVVNSIIFLQFIWGTNTNPPAPVSSVRNLRALMEYVTSMVPPDKIVIGEPVISYDWQLPFIPGKTYANSLTLDATIFVALNFGATIEFDEISQTPYFYYYQFGIGEPTRHIVWSIDARSLTALMDIVEDYGLHGTGVWNIMVYTSQIWLIINSQYDVINPIEST